MCCHVSGPRVTRGIRGEVKAVVVEGVLTTLLEGRMDLMRERQVCVGGGPAQPSCPRQGWHRWDMAGINTSVR